MDMSIASPMPKAQRFFEGPSRGNIIKLCITRTQALNRLAGHHQASAALHAALD
jgi:hypothetical protein